MKNRMRGALKSLIRLRGSDYDCARERDALGKIKSIRLNIYYKIHSEKSYSNSSENQVSCAKLISRVRDPDVWKPFLIVNLMFFLQIWNGITQDISLCQQ